MSKKRRFTWIYIVVIVLLVVIGITYIFRETILDVWIAIEYWLNDDMSYGPW